MLTPPPELRPADQPLPEPSTEDNGTGEQSVAPAASRGDTPLGQALQGTGFVAVTGPRQPTTLAWGALPRCPDCHTLVGGTQAVVAHPDEGWCIGTFCQCAQPWYTRESAWYDDPADAEQALESGDYALP